MKYTNRFPVCAGRIFAGRSIMNFCSPIMALAMILCCAARIPAKETPSSGASAPAKVAASKGAESFDVKVITYNVAGLPNFITFNRNLAPTAERFSRIGDRLQQYDIIGIQEAFIPAREIIEKKLGEYYVVHGADVGKVKLMGSGVYIYSKWTVTQSHYEKWQHLADADALSLKGFVSATVNVSPGLAIDVYNVHGQTGKSPDKVVMKLKNYERLARYMEYQSGNSGRPVLLIGDFNVKDGDPVWKSIAEGMGLTMIPDPVKGKPDHLFYKDNGSGWRISVLESGSDFTEEINGRRFSDHIAFHATLRFEKIK